MKMKQEHFDQLEQMLLGVAGDYGWIKTREGLRGFGFAVEDYYRLPPKSARWHILFAVPAEERGPWVEQVSEYLNDDNLDAALRELFGHKKGE